LLRGLRDCREAFVVTPSFGGLRVLTLESRRSTEMAALVSNYGGQPLSAPALREVPLDTNTEAFAFIDALLRHEFDLVILLTGVGTRALLAVVDRRGIRPTFLSALDSTKIAARGPKPVAVLRELGMTPWVVAPEPNTWRELLAALDAKAGQLTKAFTNAGRPSSACRSIGMHCRTTSGRCRRRRARWPDATSTWCSSRRRRRSSIFSTSRAR
jgi:hypothetical protein